MVKNSNFIKETEEYIKKINAEAVYFTANEEERTAIFMADISSADQIPKVAEPLFFMGGKVFCNNLMTMNDLKKGLS
jgi:hypothetical protein